MDYNTVLKNLDIDCLLVNSTNEYLTEYSALEENARYILTGFSGSTGDALITCRGIYLFVDGRYHTQADMEAKKGINVVKLRLGQKQDDEICKLIKPEEVLGIVSKKVSQSRYEKFQTKVNTKLLINDPVNDYTCSHTEKPVNCSYKPRKFTPENPTFITNLEEVSYLTGLRDFSEDGSAKIWGKLFIDGDKQILFTEPADEFLKNFDKELVVDKNSINAYDYSLIKYPVHKVSEVKILKSVKTDEEIELYKKNFEATDKAVMAIRKYIESNDNLSEFDIAKKLREEFINYGAESLSFKSIVAIDKNSALAHYSKNAENVFLKEGSLVLIDCGAYYKNGLATDITRVFVKGKPSELQKRVYTTVLKAFLNTYHNNASTGYEIDTLAHSLLDNKIEGFTFSHGLGHGIGINVHEYPPNLSQNEIAKVEILDNMCFTIEPGLYNPDHFGVRLENSCYRKDGINISFVKMGYEGKLIDFSLLNEQEKEWLKEFEVL